MLAAPIPHGLILDELCTATTIIASGENISWNAAK